VAAVPGADPVDPAGHTATAGLVDRIRADLRSREPLDARERESIAVFLAELERLPHPFDEHADPVHVTGSAIVVGPRGVLLQRHKHLGIWLQPGGHVDPGETPWDAALRETREETGLELRFVDGTPRLVHVDVHAGGRGHTHLDLRYLVEGSSDDPVPPVGESQEVAWFDWPAAIDVADDGLRGALVRLASSR
jgi:8-oxo-dGTP pyrophosphatase MutT (NUDIX family)